MKPQLKTVQNTQRISTPAALPEALYLSTLQDALKEDLGLTGDITSTLTIPETKTANATFVARDEGVIAGLKMALKTFELVDPTLTIEAFVTDGELVTKGTPLAKVSGKARSILTAERVALNLLGHLCGIATTTYSMARQLEGTATKLLDTRKTQLNLRALQKYAVTCGGGVNHRMGLYDMIMIKDNHIAYAGGLEAALTAAKAGKSHSIKIEVEVDTLDQLQELINLGGADIVLLDNMTGETLTKAVSMVKASGLNMVTEASGNVTPATVRTIAESGVDYISSGFITHSAKNFDVGLDIL